VNQEIHGETSGEGPAERRSLWQRIISQRPFSNTSPAARIYIVVLALVLIIVVVFLLHGTVPAGEEPGAAVDYPDEWDFRWESIKWIDGIVDWVVINWDPFFSAINIAVVRGVLGPLEDFFLWLPWWSIIVITGILAWVTLGVKFSALTVFFLGLMSIMGLIDLASQTLAITLTAAFICVIFGLPLGIIAARSSRLDEFIRPVLDMMQTMPSFVYLIPAVMLFGLGKTPAVMATCIYAIPPIIRLTNLGIRQVDAQVVEASKSFGVTAWQLLRKVQVPMALPTILAGLNQTVMMALAMVVICSMIGAQGLGNEVLVGVSRLEPGRGFIAGTAIVFMAIILDRISQGFARRPEAQRAT
jgi:glycine betaine/proline transport system permease protein